MGTSQSSQRPAKATLIFANSSLHNTDAVCLAYGLRYHISQPRELFTTSRVTTIARSDPAHPKAPYTAAQWERNTFGKDRLQVAMCGPEFAPVKQAFPSLRRGPFSRTRRTFVALGQTYIWVTRRSSIELYRMGNEDLLIAEYRAHQGLFNSKPTELLLYEDCLPFLDMLLATCLIAEQKRRDAQNAAAASGGGAGAAAGGGGGC